MALLKFTENFTLEVPQKDKENLIIKAKLLTDTPQLKKKIKEKYKDRDEEAKKIQKLQKRLARKEAKAKNIQDKLDNLNNSLLNKDIIEDGITLFRKMVSEENIKFFDEVKELFLQVKKKNDLLEEQQILKEEIYALDDTAEELVEKMGDIDIAEVVSGEHIINRVKLEDKDKEVFKNACDTYGYKLVWETILEDLKEGKQNDMKG